MRTFLITGLDGCGKSTLLRKISGQTLNGISILNVPHYNLLAFDKNDKFIDYLNSINEISYEADRRKSQSLKTIALFASMLFFKEASSKIVDSKTRILLCERHPLIDVQVYAAFYVRLKHIDISESDLRYLIGTHIKLIQQIYRRIGLEYADSLENMFRFISNTFNSDQLDWQDLKKIFDVELPDRIYYLNADVNILFDRISERSLKEPHEQLGTMLLLQKVYDQVFKNLVLKNDVQLINVDVSTFKQLDRFNNEFTNELKSIHE